MLYDDSQWEVCKGRLAVEEQGISTGGAMASNSQPTYEGRESARKRLGPPQSPLG